METFLNIIKINIIQVMLQRGIVIEKYIFIKIRNRFSIERRR